MAAGASSSQADCADFGSEQDDAVGVIREADDAAGREVAEPNGGNVLATTFDAWGRVARVGFQPKRCVHAISTSLDER
jgi:hypothetical protein